MYRVAVVQNQSEMAHYSYSDVRPLVRDQGYADVLFTGDDIAGLADRLRGDDLDAVVLSSNALNDRSILDALTAPEFAAALENFLDRGRGFLSFHQLGLAMRAGPTMSMLPDPLDVLLPVVRPSSEPITAGTLRSPAGARHVALLYPHRVDTDTVRAHALGAGPAGLYWHYWDQVNQGDWDVLLADRGPGGVDRPLVVASKEFARHRVAMSAMPLDWQAHHDVVTNLLLFAVEGRHNAAVLTDTSRRSLSAAYLLASLRARRLRFRVYDVRHGVDDLVDHIRDGIHTTLVAEPGVTDLLPHEVTGTIERSVQAGLARTLRFGDPQAAGVRPLHVTSRELTPARLLRSVQLRIHTELQHRGYIDDSFWGHIDTLQTLHELAAMARDSVEISDFADELEEAWVIAARHDRNGSYDEVFGATVALWWMRARYLGLNAASTHVSARWLRDSLRRTSQRERAFAYVTFASLRPLQHAESTDLLGIVNRLDASACAHLNENDAILYLRAALLAERLAVVPLLVARLADVQGEDGRWVDLVTTATAVSVLLDARAAVTAAGGQGSAETAATIGELTLDAVVHVLDELDRGAFRGDEDGRPYPWQGRASTSVACLRAWLKFDALINIPVHEVVETLARHDSADTQDASSRTSLSVLQELKTENRELRLQVARARDELDRAGRRSARSGWAMVGVAVFVYLVLSLLGGALAAPHGAGFVDALRRAFVASWAIHAGVIATLAALLSVPWGVLVRRGRGPAAGPVVVAPAGGVVAGPGGTGPVAGPGAAPGPVP